MDAEIIEIYEAIFLAMFDIGISCWLTGFWYINVANNDG